MHLLLLSWTSQRQGKRHFILRRVTLNWVAAGYILDHAAVAATCRPSLLNNWEMRLRLHLSQTNDDAILDHAAVAATGWMPTESSRQQDTAPSTSLISD